MMSESTDRRLKMFKREVILRNIYKRFSNRQLPSSAIIRDNRNVPDRAIPPTHAQRTFRQSPDLHPWIYDNRSLRFSASSHIQERISNWWRRQF